MHRHQLGLPWSAAALGAALLLAAGVFPQAQAPAAGVAGAEAARLMARSLESIKALRLSKGIPIDPVLDPNRTGIIGEEFTPLTTSLGDVEAKRTSTNPAFAAVLVKYFREAGLERGDVVAVGASGSFPALLIATLSAARALDLVPIVIYSIGASMYGANLPGFTGVDMLEHLHEAGLLPYRLSAVSPGGDQDLGTGVLFDDEGTALLAEARRSGVPVIEAASLAESIQSRLRVYEAASRGRTIRCFVNIGGASASFGDTPASLDLPNGLTLGTRVGSGSPTRGLVFEFAARGIPVVHLLYVRGLARDNDLPFDPVPLPAFGASREARGTHVLRYERTVLRHEGRTPGLADATPQKHGERRCSARQGCGR